MKRQFQADQNIKTIVTSYITCIFLIAFHLLIENLINFLEYIVYVMVRYFIVFYGILIANGNSRKFYLLLV